MGKILKRAGPCDYGNQEDFLFKTVSSLNDRDRFDLWGEVQEDLKGCGCPTQPELSLESRAV